MATKLYLRPPISACCVVPPIPIITKMMTMRAHRALSATHPRKKTSKLGIFRPIKVADYRSGLVGSEKDQEKADHRTPTQIKSDLYEALQGINRGIFGAPSAKKSKIEELVKLLESKNPTPEPTLFLEKVSGCWKLVYSTITILGAKRTKLGLRDFISLGDFLQTIDVAEHLM